MLFISVQLLPSYFATWSFRHPAEVGLLTQNPKPPNAFSRLQVTLFSGTKVV